MYLKLLYVIYFNICIIYFYCKIFNYRNEIKYMYCILKKKFCKIGWCIYIILIGLCYCLINIINEFYGLFI